MNRMRRRRAALALAVCALAGTARGGPVLYRGDGGWAAVAGVSGSVEPPSPEWEFQEGIWVGRIPDDVSELKWGGQKWKVAEALPPPVAPAILPPVRNAFGPCVVRSLSVRYDSVVRSRRWSLVFNEVGKEQNFHPLLLPDGRSVRLSAELEDVDSGQRWELHPTRQGREGGKIPSARDARFYASVLDGEDIEWNLVVFPGEEGRPRIVQGRVMVVKSDARRLRWRIFVHGGSPGAPVLQTESPPAIVAVSNGLAVALFPDLAEPRRYRVATGRLDAAGIEFDLAATKATGNFPRRATFSIAVDSWATADGETAPQEAVAKLARAGGGVALPEEIVREGLGAVPEFEPGAMRLSHPGGFRDRADAMHYLMLRTSGLFRDRDWAASAFQCAAQDPQGLPHWILAGDAAILAVNPDPDLETMLEMGQNRGLTLLERIRQSGVKAVRIWVGSLPGRLDHGSRALHLCDYPAVWEEGSSAPGVELGHAEAELMASLSCALKEEGICLLVEDGSPMAPFTTYYADALVCASAAPAEMRRQRALAGPRPVLWTAADPGAEATGLANELGFVRPGRIGKD